MQRLPVTSRDLACLRIAEQRAQQTRPELAQPPAPERALTRLLRRLWSWIEQPEAEPPRSRPAATHFYSEL